MSNSIFIPTLEFGNQQFNRHGVPMFQVDGERFDSLDDAIAFTDNVIGKREGVIIHEYASHGFGHFVHEFNVQKERI